MQIIPRDFVLPFVKKEQVAKDAWTFYFDRSAEKNLEFIAGNYVRLTLDITEPDERGTGRFFSITSSPLDTAYVTITTRVLQSAFKKTLASLSPGTAVKFFGPVGRFVLNEQETRPHIFVAGGIGVTPFHSMLTYAAEKKIVFPITLMVSFSTVEEIVFYDELMKIAEEHPTIKIVYTVTKPEMSRAPWAGETGRISGELIKRNCPDFLSSLFYISGPPAMVDGMLEIVKEMGVPDEQVKKEKFTGY